MTDERPEEAHDQTQGDHDQHSPELDQAASDHEPTAGTREPASTATSRSIATARRQATALQRDEAAHARDMTAGARDRTALARDAAADARDASANERERCAGRAGAMDALTALLRVLRISAAATRRAGATERASAAEDRVAAAADRGSASEDRVSAGLDELTGVFRRGTGELALGHEIARSRRLGRPLVIAMIDVDALKTVNDSQGHAAGDALLRDVAGAITATTRSYDVTVRWGGDEFVCALYDLSRRVARQRITEIRTGLAALHEGASVSAGLAELGKGDTLELLIARADADLYRSKANPAG